MKRALWIGVVAIALLLLAAAGMIARSVHRPTTADEERRPGVRSSRTSRPAAPFLT